MDAVKQYLANIGSKGGRAKGQAKARDPQAMREAQKKSVAKRKANQSKGKSQKRTKMESEKPSDAAMAFMLTIVSGPLTGV